MQQLYCSIVKTFCLKQKGNPGAYSETYQTSEMEHFEKIVSDIWQDYKYTSVILTVTPGKI